MLKIQQFAYCGLPVLLPDGLNIRGENFVAYDMVADGAIPAAVSAALAMPRMRHLKDRVLGWDEVADQLLSVIEPA